MSEKARIALTPTRSQREREAAVSRPPADQSPLAQVQRFLQARGVTGYLVGGYVRDGLLGRTRADLDIAVEGDALALTRALADCLQAAYVALHEARRVARVVLSGPDGQTVNLDVAEAPQGIVADLLRRDFTVNALALPLDALPERGDWSAVAVLDPAGGRADLAARLLRAVGPGVFRDDPLRMLRAVRLAAELGFSIVPETHAAIQRDAALLAAVAGERVHEELYRIFAAQGAARSLRLLDDLGLLALVLPEVTAGKGVSQPKEHAWDVFEHSVETVAWLEAILNRAGQRSGKASDPLDLVPWAPELGAYFHQEGAGDQRQAALLKLAGLLHDVAKPQTRGPDATGRIRFLGHAELGAKMSAAILTRLRFSSQEVQAVCAMVAHHLRPGQLSSGDQLPTDRAVYRYSRDLGAVALDTLYLNLADHLAARGPNLLWEEWQAHTAVAEHVLGRFLSEQRVVAPPRLATGHDLMAHFGIGPGPLVGRMLEAVREAQAAGEVTTQEEALAYLERWLQAANEEKDLSP